MKNLVLEIWRENRMKQKKPSSPWPSYLPYCKSVARITPECCGVIYFKQTLCVLKQPDLQKSLFSACESAQILP